MKAKIIRKKLGESFRPTIFFAEKKTNPSLNFLKKLKIDNINNHLMNNYI
jgi:hypothetical protein